MKKTFVLLELLLNVTYEGETEQTKAKWVSNVAHSGVADGYTYATGKDNFACNDFACDEMEFADIAVYDYIGSAYEEERFYVRDIVTFKHKATGEYYVLWHDELGEF
jgi:hypothetical protein